jgi:hypothetical protein
MSTPRTYVMPWAGADSLMPVTASCVAQFAGYWPDGRPLYTYPAAYAGDVAQLVTGVLGRGGYGLADPVTGIQYGITEPRGGPMPPAPPEPDGAPLMGPMSAEMKRKLSPPPLSQDEFFVTLGEAFRKLSETDKAGVIAKMRKVLDDLQRG